MNAPVTRAPPLRLPLWLIPLDLLALGLVAGGLLAQFAPDTALGAALLPFRLALLVAGGVLMALAAIFFLSLAVRHARAARR